MKEVRGRIVLWVISHRKLWGDLGVTLIGGITGRTWPRRRLTLMRTGPFLPPFSEPWCPGERSCVIVSDDLRHRLNGSGFPGLRFNPVVYKRIVRLQWETWDLTADEPETYPPSGEPGGYVEDFPHDRRTAAAMPPSWELVPPVVPLRVEKRQNEYGTFLDEYDADPHPGDLPPLFLSRETWGNCVVTDTGRAWFEANAGKWVRFMPVFQHAS